MNAGAEPFSQSWPATVDSVREARLAVTLYLEDVVPSTSSISNVALAVSEAATSVVSNAESEEMRFGVTVTVRGDAIVLTVADGADGVVPSRRDPRRALSLPLISGVSDGFIRRVRSDGTTELRVVFPTHGTPTV